eukprot:4414118-Heterocapsa_arctica.AAC.1
MHYITLPCLALRQRNAITKWLRLARAQLSPLGHESRNCPSSADSSDGQQGAGAPHGRAPMAA